MTTIDREQLRKLADEATPGRRTAEDMTVANEYGAGAVVPGHEWDGFTAQVVDGHMKHDPAFLAAADPQTVLALLDVLDAAEARVQRVRDLHHPWGDTLTGTRVCNECDHAWPCATVRALDGDE